MDFTSKTVTWLEFVWGFHQERCRFHQPNFGANESQGIEQQNLNRPPTNGEVTKKDAELTTKNGGMLPRIRNMAL